MQWKISFYLFLFSTSVICQSDLKIGEWKSFLPYNTGKWVTQSDNNIIYATDFSLVLISKDDNSSSFISKVEGLSDTGIDLIQYDDFNDHLIIVYSNSNIDILNEDEVLNVSDIKDNTNIIGSREILDIDVSQKNRMLLATSFGIVEYRSENKEFGTTVFTNLKVNSITSLSQKIYAATDDGLYVMDESINSNIGDFSKWKLLGAEEGLPTLYEGKHVRQWNNNLYFSDGLSLWESLDEGLSFSEIYTAENDFSINFLSKGNSFLIVGLRASNGSKVIYVNDQGIIEGSNSCIDRIRYAVEDEKGQVWFADNFREYRYITAIDGECKRMSFNSPLTHQVSDIAIGNNQIAIASGGVSDAFGDLFSRDGIYIQKDRNWENINESNFNPIKENDLLNFFKLVFEPNTDRLILGTFWGGIMALDTETREYEIYNTSNSSLQGAIGDGKVRISDMQYDNEDRLWISNYNTPRPLVMKDKENNWYNFSCYRGSKSE